MKRRITLKPNTWWESKLFIIYFLTVPEAELVLNCSSCLTCSSPALEPFCWMTGCLSKSPTLEWDTQPLSSPVTHTLTHSAQVVANLTPSIFSISASSGYILRRGIVTDVCTGFVACDLIQVRQTPFGNFHFGSGIMKGSCSLLFFSFLVDGEYTCDRLENWLCWFQSDMMLRRLSESLAAGRNPGLVTETRSTYCRISNTSTVTIGRQSTLLTLGLIHQYLSYFIRMFLRKVYVWFKTCS